MIEILAGGGARYSRSSPGTVPASPQARAEATQARSAHLWLQSSLQFA